MKYPLLLFLLLVINMGCNQAEKTSASSKGATISEDKAAIKAVLAQQTKAWNAFDLEGFMQGYWNSPNLKFYGPTGLTLGWQATLQRYKKRYPTKADTGTLQFSITDISPIENKSYWVMGQYYLKRSVGNAEGVFMVVFKKINGRWQIVADMSC